MSVMIQSMVQVLRPSCSSSPKQPRTQQRQHPQKLPHYAVDRASQNKSMEDFSAEARRLLEAPLETERLLAISERLQDECKQRLLESDISMLPSYQHTLPTGHERGDVLALDVGGSTFRIALIRLKGKGKPGCDGLEIRRLQSFSIDEPIRGLRGQAFFDWMADRIGEMLGEYNHFNGTTNARLPMGLAWSFPVEQTCPRSGKLLAMGKGFKATHGVEGQDLSELIMRSCQAKGLNVEMQAIVNDGAATLLSQAYRDPTTRMSLILGTGTNAAVYLPVQALGTGKYGSRPAAWHAAAQHVLVNTELSMVGKHSLPVTRWDDLLNAKHPLPDFQPLEYLVTGRYLGEIVRIILVEAVQTAGLFGGQMPERFEEPYAFDSRILAAFEADTSPGRDKARTAFLQAHPLSTPPRRTDIEHIRDIARLVSRRAAAYLATALHALWKVRTEAEGYGPGAAAHVTVACNGTIVEKYPGYRELCQKHLDELCVASGASRGAVTLKMAPESSIFGAAVAVACTEDP